MNTQKFKVDLKDNKEHYHSTVIITADLVQHSSEFDPMEESPIFTTTSKPEGVPEEWTSGYYFGDGSGGTYSSYDFPRRCGVGLHHVSLEHEPVDDAWQPLLAQCKQLLEQS